MSTTLVRIVPEPLSVSSDAGSAPFVLHADSRVIAPVAAAETAEYLAGLLRRPTGWVIPVVIDGADGAADAPHDLRLHLTDALPSAVRSPIGEDESYRLVAGASGIDISAATTTGLFWAGQTLRQLLPATIESTAPTSAAWTVEAVNIEDAPRFGYRGAMLDVARHFFGVDEVCRFIDEITRFKLNVLHLHLTDDQGWRLESPSWPRLTSVGAANDTDGGPGGFYTADDFAAIVAHAATRHVTIVPEIDVPGHTNAALAAYAELNESGVAPEPYVGTEVGFSNLAARQELSYRFVEDVFGELAAQTPGPYLHLGGDESLTMPQEDFGLFITRATAIAASNGKTVIAWHEAGTSTELPSGTIGQYWDYLSPRADAAELALSFVRQGGSLILSPADVSYLDMVYDEHSPVGQDWANGPTSVERSYRWNPESIIPGTTESDILGIEAPLWTETVRSRADIDYLVFPRLLSAAEIAWSPAIDRTTDAAWQAFSARLLAWQPRFAAAGIAAYDGPLS